ncbi:MAG TPA: serine hydrolase [Steroidobacteraceae bacterium]
MGEDDLRADLRAKFEARLKTINDNFEGVFGASFIDLTDGRQVNFNADTVMPTASAIKVAVLAELLRQADARPGMLKKQVPFAPSENTSGTGMARLIGNGSLLSLEDLAKMMINLSENTATNLLIDEIGMENVNHLTSGAGLKSIKLRRKMLEYALQAANQENVANAADAAKLMMKVANCALPLSKDSCTMMRKILEIPKTPFPATDPIPKDIAVAFKPGSLEGVLSGWGIVALPERPYVFAIMTTYGSTNATAVREASAAGFDYFWRLGRANQYGARVATMKPNSAK